jgi:hypothetical protein
MFSWRKRALVAEAEAATLRTTIAQIQQQLYGVELRFKERAALMSITRKGRTTRFIFIRNGEMIPVETIGTWDDDVDGWKKRLLEPLPRKEQP